MSHEPSSSDAGASPVESSVAAGLVQNLSQFGNPYLLANGMVCVISLEAISRRLGDRWPQRRDIVHAYLTRLLERDTDPHGLTEWLSETSVIIVQPDRPAIAGQAACLKILIQTLQHFLGDSNTEDTIVHTVTRINGGEVFGQQLDVERVIAAAASVAASTIPPPEQWSPFVASNGRRVRVSCKLEPLFLLKTSARIGYRIARQVIDMETEAVLSLADTANLSRTDLFNIDAASLSRGLDRLRSEVSSGMAASLIAPVSFITLSHPQSLARYVELMTQAAEAVRHGLICEITDYADAPSARLDLALSQIHRHCSYVIGRASLEVSAGGVPKGINGLGFEAPAMEGDAAFVGWARRALSRYSSTRSATLLFQLTGARQLALASALGATHASVASR